LDYASCWRRANTGSFSVLLRQDRFTKAICRLLHGGENWSQSRVLPSAELTYETGLSAGSIAVLAHGHQNGALTRSCTELIRLPSECIANNALRALKMVGARRLARPRLPDPKSGGSAIPREPRADKMASLTGFAPVISCMRGRRVGWTTPQGQKW